MKELLVVRVRLNQPWLIYLDANRVKKNLFFTPFQSEFKYFIVQCLLCYL